MYTTVIILAAGQGKRMNSDRNKQFLEVNNKAIIAYTIEAFVKHLDIDEIILVVNSREIRLMKEEIVNKYFSKSGKVISIIEGGKERYDSVYRGLCALSSTTDYVLIHDGARPLVSSKEISDSVKILEKEKASILGVKAKNTYKLVDVEGYVSQTVPRANLYSILTPQSFHKDVIIEAYEKGMGKVEGITDDGMMVEKTLDIAVKLVEGSYNNIKITTPDDLITMKKLIEV